MWSKTTFSFKLFLELEDDFNSSSILNTAVLNSKNTARRFTVLYEKEVVEVTKSFKLNKTIIKMDGPTDSQMNIKVC